MAGHSPWPSTLQRAATLSYTLVDEVHTLVDAEPQLGLTSTGATAPGAAGEWGAAGSSSRLDPLRRKVAVAGLILFGTLISSLGKLAYQLPAVGRDGSVRPFEKPWFMVLLMFAGMALNLPLSLFLDLVRLSRQRVLKALAGTAGAGAGGGGGGGQQQQQRRDLYVPLLQYDQYDDEVPVPFDGSLPPVLADASGSIAAAYWHHHFRRLFHKQVLLLLLPTVCDLVGAALLNIGLLSVTASATQMMRQSLLPFAALLSVGLWCKRLNCYHAAGLTGCVVGLGLVAAAALASGYGGSASLPAGSSSSRGKMAVGIAMILASQLVAAGQLLIDQSSWNTRLQLSPLKIVGCEGLLGMLLTMFVVLPLADVSSLSGEGRGLCEDSWDTLVMISSRPLLQVLLLVYTGSLQAYNICGMVTAGELTAVDTTLLQAVRTLLVWITNLAVYAVAAAVTPDSTDQQQQQHNQRLSATAGAAAAAAAAAEEMLVPGLAAQGQQQGRLPQQHQDQQQQQHQDQQQAQQQQQQADVAPHPLDALQGAGFVHDPLPAGGVSVGQQQQQQQPETHAETGAGSDEYQQQQQHQQQHLASSRHNLQPPSPPRQQLQMQPGHSQDGSGSRHSSSGSSSSSSRPSSSSSSSRHSSSRPSSSRPSSSRPSSSRARARAQHQATSYSQQGAGPLQQALLGCCYGAAVGGAAAATAAVSAVAALTAGSVSGAGAGAAAVLQVAAAQTGTLALPPAGSATAAAAAAGQAGSFHASAAVAPGLPGEPWLVWSFMQAAGFALLVLAAITYSRGDSERWRRQLAAEAALIFADMPPFGGGGAAAAAAGSGRSRAASVASVSSAAAGGSYRPFTANMDIDSVAFLRSSQGAGYGGGGRWRRGGDSLYGVTPISNASPLWPGRDSGSPLARSVASGGGVVGGLSPELDDADGGADGLLGSVEVGQQAEV